jgi:hypothetical protein
VVAVVQDCLEAHRAVLVEKVAVEMEQNQVRLPQEVQI